MAIFKCNDPVYTVLRNGKVITMSGTPNDAIDAIAADALNVVCPPECCITEVPITTDSFDIVVTNTVFTGLYVRATITHGLDIYSTTWVAAAATNTIDVTGLIVEFGSFNDGDTICIDFTYDQITVLDGCCLTIVVDTVDEEDTYQLSTMVTECDGGTFDLVFQNPDGGVTVDAAGEMVVPQLDDTETVYVTYTCDDCVTELLILTASNVNVPCCIEALDYDADTFEVTVSNTDAIGWYVRVNLNDSDQTAWALSDGDDTIDLSGLTNAFEDGDLYCVEYTEDPEADPIVIVPGSCCFTVRADTYLEDATYDVSGLVDPCEGGTFDLLYQNPAMGVTLDAAGEMIVPDLAEDGTVYGTFTCDGCVTDFLVLSVIEPPVGLRMVFNDIVNAPVVDPSDVAEWNTFFDLPTNGLVFTSVAVAGNQVTLVGGGAMTIKSGAFVGSTALLKIEDQAGIVDVVLNSAFLYATGITDAIFDSTITVGAIGQVGAFMGATSLANVSLAGATSFLNGGVDGTFKGCTSIVNLSLPDALLLPNSFLFGCTSLETFSAPLATTLESLGMANCTSITAIDLSSCVNLGADPTDDSVWQGVIGQIVTLDIAAINATNNAGGVHASVAYLIANNTATVNYI